MIITKRHLSAPHGAEGARRHRRPAVPRRDGAGGDARWRRRQRRARSGSSPWRWSTAPPAAAPTAARTTSGRRPPSGRNFDLSPTSLAPLEPLRDYLTIVSNTDARWRKRSRRRRSAAITSAPARSSSPRRIPSRRWDRICMSGRRSTRFTRAQFGQDTAIPSMQLCDRDASITPAAASTTTRAPTPTRSAGRRRAEPLPMLRDPRAVFDALFGVGATPEERARRRREDRSMLDTIVVVDRSPEDGSVGAADRARLQRLPRRRPRDRAAAFRTSRPSNRSGEHRELPNAPMGVPDSFDEHVKLMFDLQAVALASEHHARVRVQAVARRLGPRLPADRRHHRVPQRVAPRRAAGARFSTSRRSTHTTSAWCRTSSSG